MRFRRETVTGAAALALAGLITVSCGGINDPSKNTTETFTGSITKGGQGPVHPFTVSSTGEFTIKVTSFTPTYSSIFGTYYGQLQSDNSCSLFQSNPQSLVNSPALSSSILKGTYCVVAYDVGGFTATETYTMTVSHP